MKNAITILAAVVLSAATCPARDDFDFAKISNDRFGHEDPSNPELVKNGLAFKPGASTCWNPQTKKDELFRIDPKSLSIVNGAEEDNYAMFIPATIADRVGGVDMVERMHTAASQTIPLPDAAGGKYRLRVKYRADHKVGKADFNCYVVLQAGTNNFVYVSLPDTGEDSEYWVPREREFSVPAGAKTLKITLRFDGAGYLRVGSLGIKRCKEVPESAVTFSV